MTNYPEKNEIVHLNVGGTRFSTSVSTLTFIPDTFFTSLLSRRISSTKDESGAFFIDRDPEYFPIILNYLRNGKLTRCHTNVNFEELYEEAQFYSLGPLSRQIQLSISKAQSSCGNIHFFSFLKAPPSLNSIASISPSVQSIEAHGNCIAVSYSSFVGIYTQTERTKFELTFMSSVFESTIRKIAVNTKMQSRSGIVLAVGFETEVTILEIEKSPSCEYQEIHRFDLHDIIDKLFFIGIQLVAISFSGKIGVWNSQTTTCRTQELSPITSIDPAGSILFLGSQNGFIYFIDMEKFPLRMKDNDILVTELCKDPENEPITSLSVYLIPRELSYGYWIEVAYGTASGTVVVVVVHPENTVRQGVEVFQTFVVHQSSILSVKLSEKYLVSVCSKNNHVRSWALTRFRGLLSTQPLSSSIASFNIVNFDESEDSSFSKTSFTPEYFGPFGDQDDEPVLLQKVFSHSNSLFVRLASTGSKVCVIKAIDGSPISSFFVHKSLSSSRQGHCSPRRFIFTGHSSGAINIWDLTTALDHYLHGSPDSLNGDSNSVDISLLLNSQSS